MTDFTVNNTLEAQTLEWIATQQSVMVQNLWTLASINSGSYNVKGVNKVADTLALWSKILDCELEYIPMPPHEVVDDFGNRNQKPLGQALRLFKRPQAPTHRCCPSSLGMVVLQADSIIVSLLCCVGVWSSLNL